MRPKIHPDEVIAGYLEADELLAMRGHLLSYQRLGEAKWDTYREKIPSELLEKWTAVLFECRKNGFIWPLAFSDKIAWHQVLGNPDFVDQCTMCSRNIQNGDCESTVKIAPGDPRDGEFIPCWKEEVTP